MPQIIVIADDGAAFTEGAVTHRERVNVTDFESQHFATQLVERLGWAVEDADQVERHGAAAPDPDEIGDEPDEISDEPTDEPRVEAPSVESSAW